MSAIQNILTVKVLPLHTHTHTHTHTRFPCRESDLCSSREARLQLRR